MLTVPKPLWLRLKLCLLLVAFLLSGSCPQAWSSPRLKHLEASLPRRATDCTAELKQALDAEVEAVEGWAADLVWSNQRLPAAQTLGRLDQLIEAKKRVDAGLEDLLRMRGRFVEQPAGDSRREMLRQYLRMTSRMIDLSGHLRFLLADAITNGSYVLSSSPQQMEQLLDLLERKQVRIGAWVLRWALFDPPAGSPARPFPVRIKRRLLRMIAAARQSELLPSLANYVQQTGLPADMLIQAAETIRAVGLPQDPIVGQDAPDPPITAAQLLEAISRIDRTPLTADLQVRRDELVGWLNERMQHGLQGDVFHFDQFQLRAGDWLLMRNPSPYNCFTDLAPGLFTHVGVVTLQTDEQGIRRFVVVEIRERGDRVPATTVDAYLQRTLHYVFLRHEDPEVQAGMGQAAAAMIGNETEFDLTFRTERVLLLKDKPLEGQRINTYCAGFLLICAQHTGAPREEFFPIPEYPAPGYCEQNMAKLGISLGDNFVSPTGAMFSPNLQLVGAGAPMYSPERQIKETIYDHFAQAMVDKRLTPAPDTFQQLREQVAGLSKEIPWLARTLARTNNVSQYMDLETAAKAAAVIEALDQIADASRDGFTHSYQAMVVGPESQMVRAGLGAAEIERVKKYRRIHEDLYSQWLQRRLTPRQLRIELVEYYERQGKRALDERFFAAPE